MEWTKVSGGHTLTITMDADSLTRHLDDRIREIKSCTESDRQYECHSVYEDRDKILSVEKCVEDLEKMKTTIASLAADTKGTLHAIWPKVSLKKDGTFKRSVKPIIREEIFGPYWEDSYGWNVEVLRIEPVTDTEAVIVLVKIVRHY